MTEPYDIGAEIDDQQRSKALAQALRYVGAGLGAGLLGTGAYQLARFMRAPTAVPSAEINLSPQESEIAFPSENLPRKKKKPLLSWLSKKADLADWLSRHMLNLSLRTKTPSTPQALTPTPEPAPHHSRFPFYLPIAMLGGSLAAYGGYRGINSLMQRRRRKELDDDLRDAESEYNQAALSQFGPPRKLANFTGAGNIAQSPKDALDLLHDNLLEKRAFGEAISSVLGAIPGAYLTYALGSGGIAAWLAYKKNKDRMADALESALKRRATERALQAPPDLELLPVASPYPDMDAGDTPGQKKKKKLD